MEYIASNNPLYPTTNVSRLSNPTPLTIATGSLFSTESLQQAFLKVKSNHGVPGIDGQTVEAFAEGLPEPNSWAISSTVSVKGVR